MVTASLAQVHAAIRAHTGNVVSHGPFTGMIMPDNGAKFYYGLGTYELELHPIIRKLDDLRFVKIVNVGAGDGYYAVGLALRHPEATVTAFESLECALPYLETIARANALGDRFRIMGRCAIPELEFAIGDGPEVLIFMDCEGDEGTLLDPAAIPILRTCHILVELHEFVHEGIAGEIRRRFSSSHAVTEVWSHPRTVADLPFQPEPDIFTGDLRPYWLSTIDENRPTDMRWLYMEPIKC